MKTESRHQCFIYEGSPSKQLPALAAKLIQRLNEGFRCLYLNSPTMVAGLRSCLAEMGLDVAGEVARGSIVLSSEALPSEDGSFDVELMLGQLESALDQSLKDGFKGLWATGDMSWEFGAERNFVKLMDYEQRLEQLFQARPELCGICQYHKDTLPAEVPSFALLTHQSVFINETITRMNPLYLPPGSPPDDGAKRHGASQQTPVKPV